MSGWVFLAFRSQHFIGAGERMQDAQSICQTKAARRGERRRRWTFRDVSEQSSWNPYGEIVALDGAYQIKRVPVAYYFAEDES